MRTAAISRRGCRFTEDAGREVCNSDMALCYLMYAMACRGAWRPALEFLADAVARQTGIRDSIAGEKVLHGFLAACMGIADCFLFRPEREQNGGGADLCLEPFLTGHPQMRHGYPVELRRAAETASSILLLAD